ncbi:MAG: hypothetical protein SFV32_06790 [Opitutaceae bacterium]|nr:hypothetical protein [Opitutaceae bacterium]
MKTNNLIAGAFALSLLGSSAQAAAVNYLGNATDGDLTTIIDLSARTIRSAGSTTTYPSSAAFQAALGGTHTDATTTSRASWQWPASETFVLEDNVFIANGDLFIEPGSIVRGQPRSGAPFDGGSLFIARGAKILAQGGVGAPIVFTTAALNNAGSPGARATGQSPAWWDADPINSPKAPSNAGLWGGLLVLGNALTNSDRLPGTATQSFSDIDGVLPVNADDRFEIEGIPAGDASNLGFSRFGGFAANDNSGELSYVSLRHGGANIAANNEINGLTLGAVGRGTVIRFVEVWGNTDDGIEIFGGSVNLSNVVVVGQQDDGLDIDVGYTGTIQYALVVNSTLSDKLGEWDGSYELETSINGVSFPASGPVTSSLLPTAQFVVANATLIGNNGGSSTTSSGLHIRDQAAPRLVNSIIVNPSKQGTSGPIEFDNRSTGAQSTLNLLDKEVSFFKGVTFFDASGTLTTVNQFVDNGSSSNTIARAKLGLAKFQNEFNVNPGFANIPSGNLSTAPVNAFDPRPTSAGAGVFEDDILLANAAFQAVGYRGAFDPNESTLWTFGWTAAEAFNLLID